MVLVGNKADLEGERKVPQGKAIEWCKAHGGLPYLETSAAKDGNILKVFEIITVLSGQNRGGETPINYNWNYA